MASKDQPDCPAQDDASIGSIEILSESGDSHAGESEWSICSAGSFAGNDVGSMDFQKLSIHSKMAKIAHHDGRQFIERRDSDDGGLPYSAEFYLGDELWKLNGEDCLLMSHRRYIAKVSMDGTVDLDGAVTFEEVVRMLLKHLQVGHVLLDELLDECTKAKSGLKVRLDKLSYELEGNKECKWDVMLLRILLRNHGNSLNVGFKHGLQNCSRLSSQMMSALARYVTVTLKMIERNEMLCYLNVSSLSDEFIDVSLQQALDTHRARVAAICPSNLMDKLEELSVDQTLYVSTDDVSLFNELTKLDQTIFGAALPIMFSKLLAKAKAINDDQLPDLEPLSSPLLLYVCKSLQEVAGELEALTITDNVIIYSEELGWKVAIVQNWPKCTDIQYLRQQLQMLAKLANHFETGGSFRTGHFPYEFKLFQNMDAIPEPVRIWLCLLDDCMKDVVQADMDKMQMLSNLFQAYASFVTSEDFRSETLECLRRITQESLRSLTRSLQPFQNHCPEVDLYLQEYDKMISCCLSAIPREYFGNDRNQIEALLRRIFSRSEHKNVWSCKSTTFLEAFKHLLEDISDVSFEWFIQLPPSDNRTTLLQGHFIVPVDNRWKDTEHECLKVVDLDGFVKVFRALRDDGDEIPRHYQLQVMQLLLQYVDELGTSPRWRGVNYLSRDDQLEAMTCTIRCIRSSILYLREQPEYACFEEFVQKMREPFAQAVEESSSLEDFSKRMLLVGEWKMKDVANIASMDDEQTLKLISEIGCPEARILESAFNRYTAEFNRQLMLIDRMTRVMGIEVIVAHVKKNVPCSATRLPETIACLSLVWSLIDSKDENSLVKPCCRHICEMLRLFSPDYNDLKHGQIVVSSRKGKQMILGLTTALLALFGINVLIVCFNSTLAQKNTSTLLQLLRHFSLDSMVSFGSVEDMARERSKTLFGKYANYVNQSLGLATSNRNSSDSKAQLHKNTVLLIDDIDVLLLEKRLAQSFERTVIPAIPGLGLLQKKIFCSDKEISLERIEKFVDMSDLPGICELRAFQKRSKYYKIPVGPSLLEKRLCNKTLLTWHLESMIHSRSQLTSAGAKTAKSSTDYVFADYTKVATYLNRKQSSHQQIEEGHRNYGYLSMNVLSFPYASLLNSFPLIVSFGSEPLQRYEYSILRSYGKMHVFEELLPGEPCPTRFDPKKNFLAVLSELDWLIAVLGAINAAIERDCLVLVFFENKQKMRQFRSEFTSQLKRMSVTAIETASNGKYNSNFEIAIDEIAVLAIEIFEDSSLEREVHVIQTFFSNDSTEEDLIRRQAERSYSSGSYELIVCMQNTALKSYKTTYDTLVKFREYQCIPDIEAHLRLQEENYAKLVEFCSKI